VVPGIGVGVPTGVNGLLVVRLACREYWVDVGLVPGNAVSGSVNEVAVLLGGSVNSDGSTAAGMVQAVIALLGALQDPSLRLFESPTASFKLE